jgi:arsenate reductase
VASDSVEAARPRSSSAIAGNGAIRREAAYRLLAPASCSAIAGSPLSCHSRVSGNPVFETMKATIYHNPKCSTSRNVLALLRERGIEPTIIEYLTNPLSNGDITALVQQMGVPLRDIVRAKEPLYAELKLAHADDDTLLAAMVMHPILLNRPIVVSDKGTKLCRPSESVGDIL